MSFLSFGAIVNFFENNTKAIGKGENSLNSGHLKKCFFDPASGFVDAEVQASMKQKVYKVTIEYDTKQNKIKSGSCDCPVGQVNCHHMAVPLLHLNRHLSKTDVACSWIEKKNSNPGEKVKPVEESDFRAISTKCDINAIHNQHKQLLKQSGVVCGFSFLFAEEPEPVAVTNNFDNLVLENVLFSQQFQTCQDRRLFLRNIFRLDKDDSIIEQIATATIGQANNTLWRRLRRYRITASNFHLVLKAIGRNRYPPSLFRTLEGLYNLDGVKAIQWGRNHEDVAVQKLQTDFGCVVSKTGVWLSECGILAASPDGIILDSDGKPEYVVEVKCPFQYRNEDLYTAYSKDTNYIIIVDAKDNNSVCYNEQHPYYDQIQGQMYLTNCNYAILVVWSLVNSITIKIPRCNNWAKNLNLLKIFFYNIYIPHLLKTE